MIRIVAPHFVAGIEPGVMWAPILSYMKTWDRNKILDYCLRKGWEVGW